MSTAAVRLARLVVTHPVEAVGEAKRILNDHARKLQRANVKQAPRRRVDEEVRLAAKEAHLRLVDEVTARAKGICELCGGLLVDGFHFHHLEGGPAKMKLERLANVMAVCPDCHEAYHMNVRSFVPTVKAWCAHHGYPLPRRKEFR